MFLFIFESIGTQELVLIGIVALIFLGPRRMPEMARKLGKLMADFRNTTSEFRSTWEREINFEQEEHAIRTELPPQPIAHTENGPAVSPSAPEVKEIDADRVRSIFPQTEQTQAQLPETKPYTEESPEKRDWL